MRLDASSICFLIGVIVSAVSFWVPRYISWAVAAIALGMLLIGR